MTLSPIRVTCTDKRIPCHVEDDDDQCSSIIFIILLSFLCLAGILL